MKAIDLTLPKGYEWRHRFEVEVEKGAEVPEIRGLGFKKMKKQRSILTTLYATKWTDSVTNEEFSAKRIELEQIGIEGLSIRTYIKEV